MSRTAINPWPWSAVYGFDQAECIEPPRRWLLCSGQTAMDAGGFPVHPGDMEAQLRQALENLESVLCAADMSMAQVVRLVIYTTDVPALLPHMGLLASRLGRPTAQTLLGVSSLAFPELMVELEATAVA